MTEPWRFHIYVPVVAMLAVLLEHGRVEASNILEQFSEPGIHAIMRHAIAPGTGDPPNFKIGDCNTQRNLDARGREQARKIGDELRESGITFDRILTSQWCRCRETARLLDLGIVESFPALNSFFGDRSTADDQTQAVRALLASLPDDERILLVTHQVNISALTGRYPNSGEVFLIRKDDTGEVEVIGAFLPDR